MMVRTNCDMLLKFARIAERQSMREECYLIQEEFSGT